MPAGIDYVTGLEFYARGEVSCVLYSPLDEIIEVDIGGGNFEDRVESPVGVDGVPTGRLKLYNRNIAGVSTGLSQLSDGLSYALANLDEATVVLEFATESTRKETLFTWGSKKLLYDGSYIRYFDDTEVSIPVSAPSSRFIVVRYNTGTHGESLVEPITVAGYEVSQLWYGGDNSFGEWTVEPEPTVQTDYSNVFRRNDAELLDGNVVRSSGDWATFDNSRITTNIVSDIENWTVTPVNSEAAIYSEQILFRTNGYAEVVEAGASGTESVLESPLFDVTGSALYTTGLHVNPSVASPNSSVTLKVQWLDSSGAVLSTDTIDTTATGGAEPQVYNSWLRLSGNQAAPVSAVQGKLIIDVNFSSGESWIIAGARFNKVINTGVVEFTYNNDNELLVAEAETLNIVGTLTSGLHLGTLNDLDVIARFYNGGAANGSTVVATVSATDLNEETVVDTTILTPAGTDGIKLVLQLKNQSGTEDWLISPFSLSRTSDIGTAYIEYRDDLGNTASVVPGETYRFTALVNGDTAQLNLDWRTGLSYDSTTSVNTVLDTAYSNWKLVSVEGTAPVGTDNVRAYITASDTTRIAIPRLTTPSGAGTPLMQVIDQFNESESVAYATSDAASTFTLGDNDVSTSIIAQVAVFNIAFDDAKLAELFDAALNRISESYSMGTLSVSSATPRISNVTWSTG